MSGNLRPIGFWSYATADDADSEGHLSRLRDSLERHLGRVFGRPVPLFQDRPAIRKGADWRQAIDHGLANASFLVPVITPAFLRSEWCCREVLRFRERELALGRNDLIFPFHFTNTDHVNADDPEQVADRAAYELLKSRQLIDFRQLELEDTRNLRVRYELRHLSDSIHAALQRPAGQVSRPAGPSNAGFDDFGTWADIAIPAAGGGVVKQRMRLIPAGRFQMGSPEREPGRYDDEGPRHTVTIGSRFWLFDTPCTQELWEAVMGNNPSRIRSPDHPVERVSFQDVQSFLVRLNGLVPNLDLCLPSEAQWEYACRAGTNSPTYAGPANMYDPDSLDAIAWYGGNSLYESAADQGPRGAGTFPVKAKAPNRWGLHDMLGNVWEWCADTWHESYDGAPADGSAWTSGGATRVFRGGSWSSEAHLIRAACRAHDKPDLRNDRIGFRCARVYGQSRR